MKQILQLLIFFLSLQVYAQDFKKIDATVLSYPKKFKTPEALTTKIKQDFATDTDKVRAIYTWIATNVEYDEKEYDRYNFSFSTEQEYKAKNKKYEKKLSKHVISKRKAVCEGYATLFNELCRLLNISSKKVDGYAKNEIREIGTRYSSNHTWNIVEIDKKKYLIDVTWAKNLSGSKNVVDNFYFLAPPEKFILSHYPDNYANALLETNISKKTFVNYPIYYSNRDAFEIVSPTSGIIKRDQKNVIIKLKTQHKVHDINYDINDTYESDVSFEQKDDLVTFTIPLTVKRKKELTIYLNHEAIVSYKFR